MAKHFQRIDDVQVIDIGDKGTSIARTPAGEIIIIQEHAVPGDIVDVKWKRKKKGLKLAYPLKWKKRSDQRTEAFCEHFDFCGGCKWQNLHYDAQLQYKEKQVKDTIRRIAKENEELVYPIVPCLKTREYRNKLEYTFSEERWLTPEEISSGATFTERRGCGFHVSGCYDKVLDLKACHLQEHKGNVIRNFLRDYAISRDLSFYNIKENRGFLRNLVIRNTVIGEWMVIVVVGESHYEDIDAVFEALTAEFDFVNSWYCVINPKKNSSMTGLSSKLMSGAPYISEKLGSVSYQISPQSFFQTNSYQALNLYSIVKDMAVLKGDEVVYDLYTGTGSIALFIADACARVVGIEEVSAAIADAEMNAQSNQIENVDFIVGDVKDVLSAEFQTTFGAPDVIVTDPPRAGMHPDVVKTLLNLGAEKVVYISCNPSTQARDIQLLSAVYRLERVVPVDMFPHTSHIESVALLRHK